MASRSRCRYRGAVSSGNALMTCWPVHKARGASVTLQCTMRRRSCARTTKRTWTRRGDGPVDEPGVNRTARLIRASSDRMIVPLRKHGGRVKPVRWLGRRILSLAMIGVRPPTEAGVGSALSRVATVGFGVDIYTAGVLATGLPVPRLVGWTSAIAGDLLWFTVLLGTSIAAAGIVDDDRVVGLVMI